MKRNLLVVWSLWEIGLAVCLFGAWLPAPSGATTLFGLVDTGELYASTNGGTSWSIRATLPVTDAVGLAAGATALDLFLATRTGSIYRSSDGGTTWTVAGAVAASDLSGFAIGPFGALVALTRTGTVYSSSNGGTTWTPLAALAGPNWVSLARGPQARLYALTETGEVARSADQGATWIVAGAVAVSNAVSVRRLANDLYVLTATGEVYRSLNDGTSWTPVGTLTASGASALADVGSGLVAVTRTGEVATSPNGAAWTWVGAINQLAVMALGADTPQVTGVDVEGTAPRFSVRAPYPNPRVGPGGVTFSFTLALPERVRWELYDARGRLRAVRPFGTVESAGSHAAPWDAAGVPSGTYLVRFVTESGHTSQTKWTLLR